MILPLVTLLESFVVSLILYKFYLYLDLDHKYFNQPLRRDIVSRVFHYFNVKGVKLNKRVKTVGDTAGSGKKPTPQKGQGRAR